MPVVVSFFDTKIIRLIEAHDYGNTPPMLQGNDDFWHDLGFSLKAIFWNIICLPLYLVPVVNLCVFYVLNGYLLGREFFVMAARRHVPVSEADESRRKYSTPILMGAYCSHFWRPCPSLISSHHFLVWRFRCISSIRFMESALKSPRLSAVCNSIAKVRFLMLVRSLLPTDTK